MKRQIIMLVSISSLLLGCSTNSVANDSHHYIGKKYYISENTELIYPRKTNVERYKVCEGIKGWLEGKDVPINVLKPVYSGKSLEDEGFQKYLSECEDLSIFSHSSDASPHRAENEVGEEVVYWTGTGNHYESRYFELYANGVNVLYAGPRYHQKEGSNYIRGGKFFVLTSGSCELSGVHGDSYPLFWANPRRASLSNIIQYKQSYYIVSVQKESEKSKAYVYVFDISNNKKPDNICNLKEK